MESARQFIKPVYMPPPPLDAAYNNHWLLKSPADFLDWQEYRNEAHSNPSSTKRKRVYKTLTLYLFFFVQGEIQLLEAEIPGGAASSRTQTVFADTIAFDTDGNGQRASKSNKSLRDIIITEILEDGIAQGHLEDLQFSDFLGVEPVKFLSIDGEPDCGIAVLLSLSASPRKGESFFLRHTDGTLGSTSCVVTTEPVDRVEMKRKLGDWSLQLRLTEREVDAVFDGFYSCLPANATSDAQRRTLMHNSLSTIVAVQSLHDKKSLRRGPQHGFIAVKNTNSKQGTYIFLEDAELNPVFSELNSIDYEGERHLVTAFIRNSEVFLRDEFHGREEEMLEMFLTGRSIVTWIEPTTEKTYLAHLQRRIAYDETEQKWDFEKKTPEDLALDREWREMEKAKFWADYQKEEDKSEEEREKKKKKKKKKKNPAWRETKLGKEVEKPAEEEKKIYDPAKRIERIEKEIEKKRRGLELQEMLDEATSDVESLASIGSVDPEIIESEVDDELAGVFGEASLACSRAFIRGYEMEVVSWC